jgi:hypothetical protein
MRSMPPDFIDLLDRFEATIARLTRRWSEAPQEMAKIQGEWAKRVGFNNFVEVASAANQKVALYAVSPSRCGFLVPPDGHRFSEGELLVVRLYFRQYKFLVSGAVAAVTIEQKGVQRIEAKLDFSVEFVDLLEGHIGERWGPASMGK